MVWSFSEGNDASNRGRMTARLGYGVPESDNVQLDGVCEARSGTSVMSANLILGAEVGKLADGANVNLRFTGGGFNHFVSGSVYGTKLEEGITGISLDVKVNDPLWKALTEQDSLDYLVPGYSASKLSLKGGHDKIRQFIRACRSYAEALGPEKTVKTGDEPKKTAQYKVAAAPGEKPTPPSGVTEKEAYEAAKELGTIEAWEAFLNNFPTGFRADLARAYVKRIASEAPAAPAPVQTQAPPPLPPVVVATPPPLPPLVPINPGPGTSPWGNGIFPMDEGNSSVYSASVKSSGLELVAYCGIDQTLTMLLTERPPGIYPQFSGRIAQGLATSQLSMQFSNGAAYPVAASVQGLTGDVELRSAQGGGFNPKGSIAKEMMSGNSVTLSAPPFGATFQLTKSRAAICRVVNSCGVAVAGCKRFRAPAVTTRQPALRKKTITRKSPAGRCSSRSVWLDGQCILKSRVTSFCGPGYHREGSNCVSNANRAATAPRGGQQAGCPSGQLRIGNNCVNINLAPLFGKLKKSGQGGGSVPPPGANVKTLGSGKPKKGGGKNTQKPKMALSEAQVYSKIIKYCVASGVTLTKAAHKAGSCQELAKNRTIRVLNAPDPAYALSLLNSELLMEAAQQKARQGGCKRGFIHSNGKCVASPTTATKSTPNTRDKELLIVPFNQPKAQIGPQKSRQEQLRIACIGDKVWRNGKCVAIPTTAKRTVGCQPGFKLSGGKCVAAAQQQACISNQVRLANGQCVCPSNKPRWSKGKCKKEKGVNRFLKQLQQPQNAPRQQQNQQQPPQNQGQQQLQNLLNQFSDVRLKRDVTHLATLSSGIRLYAFRYVWEDRARVGVMAQDLLSDPAWRDAVSLHASGYYRVDYGALGLRMVTLDEWRSRGLSSVMAGPVAARTRSQAAANPQLGF